MIQILDCELYELMHAHGDYTHFYFCYRWFLLDFKRELLYQDVSNHLVKRFLQMGFRMFCVISDYRLCCYYVVSLEIIEQKLEKLAIAKHWRTAQSQVGKVQKLTVS